MSVSVRPATREDARVSAEAVAMAIGSESAVLYCGENYLDVLEEVVLEKGTQYSYENSLVRSHRHRAELQCHSPGLMPRPVPEFD